MLILFLFISYTFKKGSHIKELKAGLYTVECYGAQGGQAYKEGNLSATGGLGAYVKGTMNVTGTGTTFYIFVGGEGKSGKVGPNLGGFNGGGSSGKDLGGGFDKIDDAPGGGGGATDLRIDDNSLGSRIIVAGGGSGGAAKCPGAPGGELYGYYSPEENYFLVDINVGQDGALRDGIGTSGKDSEDFPGSGGGGGYVGGPSTGKASSNKDDCKTLVASSGNSYISGYGGCSNNSKVQLTSGYMAKGVKEGNGLITIDQLFKCSTNCESCKDSSTCYKCYNNFLYNNKCQSYCPSGYYANTATHKCVQCTSPCAACSTSISKCTKCKEGFYLLDEKCIPKCPVGYYVESQKCMPCKSPCENCTSETTCLTCLGDYVFNNGKCEDKCPDGMVRNGNVCEKCHPFCSTCSQTAAECTSCIDGYYLHGTKCLASCPDTTYEKGGQCVDCKSPCKTCTDDAEHCTTCIDNFLLHVSENKCVGACPDGTNQSGVVCI